MLCQSWNTKGSAQDVMRLHLRMTFFTGSMPFSTISLTSLRKQKRPPRSTSNNAPLQSHDDFQLGLGVACPTYAADILILVGCSCNLCMGQSQCVVSACGVASSMLNRPSAGRMGVTPWCCKRSLKGCGSLLWRPTLLSQLVASNQTRAPGGQGSLHTACC